MTADASACDTARSAHLGIADEYRELIDRHRTTPAKRALLARRRRAV